jgi:L-malate glycosyltransferase
VTLHLIIQLKEDGNEVRCILNGWNDGVFKQKLLALGIPFDEVKLGWIYVTRPAWTLDTLAHWRGAYLSCKKILEDFGPDICHFCGYAPVIMLFPLLRKRNCVYNLQEPHAPTRKHRLIYSLLNKRIKIFTAVSKHIVQVLLALNIPAGKIRLIYNGVPVLQDAPVLEMPGDILVLGIIGQVVPWKGHETLVEAVEILIASPHQPFIVHIFGNDKNEYAEKLQAKIKSKNAGSYFVWKGFVKEQADIYRQVDIVVVPSLSQEPCSLTILEGLMRGKAVIASDRGGNTELIDDTKNGFIFKAGDAVSLAACIDRLLKDKTLTATTGNNGRAKALEQYTATGMRKEYDKVYTEIVQATANVTSL